MLPKSPISGEDTFFKRGAPNAESQRLRAKVLELCRKDGFGGIWLIAFDNPAAARFCLERISIDLEMAPIRVSKGSITESLGSPV